MCKCAFNSTAGHLAVSVGVLAVLAGGARAGLLPITIVEQSHHAWGHIEDVNYDFLGVVPVTGGCSKTIETDFIQIESNTLGSGADELNVYARAQSIEDYFYDHSVQAEVHYLFHPNAIALTIAFDGAAGYHSFESGLVYLLRDVTTDETLDTRSWEFEDSVGWVDDVLPYTNTYVMDLSHTYSLSVGAYAQLGDQREGFAQLAALLTPEPGSAVLWGVALAAAARLRRRRA